MNKVTTGLGKALGKSWV